MMTKYTTHSTAGECHVMTDLFCTISNQADAYHNIKYYCTVKSTEISDPANPLIAINECQYLTIN